jgi:hypothetical protein
MIQGDMRPAKLTAGTHNAPASRCTFYSIVKTGDCQAEYDVQSLPDPKGV